MPTPISFFTDTEIISELGRRIQRLRTSKDLQQIELAKRAGVSSQTVSRAELGEAISLKSLIAIARALGRTDDFAGLLFTPPVSPIEIAELEMKRVRKRVRR